MFDSYSSSSYYYSSTTNAGDGSATTGRRHATTSYTDNDGTTVVRAVTQDLGQPAIVEERRYDRTGQEQLQIKESDHGTSAGGIKRITDLDEEDPSGLDISTAYGGPAPVIDEATSYDLETNPFGTKILDRDSGAYDEHMDYDTAGGTSHHREVRDVDGRMFKRNFDIDGRVAREHREYENPRTGIRLETDKDVDISDVI
ncbi:hypothetical protein N7448_010827 [Penicillium atrosanguineum]|uniref:Uncharacterized protein n=1 Tax=Penicillium atrosanguineum TaxID=1132637 RepID=A0A9W9KUL0_9EURO|nr:uncharacterized protein N7443_008048 [Penicillium atrosanguineum]KAJ5119119.1 hypothetical protein N7526_010756 [Penicillium atrosanguineum]KAJ5120158.1 hypothetical protein N7448_010827 [Penicillium atrosanguineum]KAJ5297155.1 hypothetical protein N7443_008048 [Penicillium atrosanguineum]KAJ5299915.1 hypothetical protein N7476_011472 [Penicillium atrosanguineum]